MRVAGVLGRFRTSLAPAALLLCAAAAQGAVVGVNVWNEGYLSPAQQERELQDMAASGVRTIRTSLFQNSIDFIVKASQRGISSVVIVYPFLGTKAKSKGGWAAFPLSALRAEEFTQGFKPLLEQLEAAGVRLAAMELGSEINTTANNGDLPNPGSGRELRLSDLNNPSDREGSAVANGYRNYIQIMATLKDLRDHSRLNQRTPVISAGLAQKLGGKQIEVNLRDTLEFWHRNGIDTLVDGYGIHVYPSADPNRSVPARIASLDEGMFSACRQGGKPCWVTEWGFGNGDESCPVHDELRVKLNQSIRSAFAHFASQGLLEAILYYDWTEVPGRPDSWAIFRCGSLTEAGKVALGPM
jgi:hypothetical protein